MPSLPRPILLSLVTLAMLGACVAIPEGEGIPPRITDRDDASADTFVTVDASTNPTDASSELPPADPHSLIGVNPPHGPFSGGRLALVRGNGFKSNARVWFGANEVPASDITPVDPTRIQVVVPPGIPGPADVTAQNGDDESTSRVLPGGYEYDLFYAEPSSGPTTGGTLVRILGMSTAWDASTEVRVGDELCLATTVISASELECAAPPHPAGTVSISIGAQGETPAVVYDAFTYSDSDNGYKGGLSGSPLSGTLKVAAYHAYTGAPVVGAHVIAGDDLDTAIRGKTDGAGIVVLQDPGLQGTRSVTIAKTCYQPTTFVDVPVDTVTTYLSPVLSAACLGDGGEVPPVGGKGANPALLEGELVWIGGTEFKRATWNNVPAPVPPHERQAAYLFQPTWDPTGRFSLPDAARAVLPDADGGIGYEFSTTSGGGNITLYALAGIENRKVSPATFTAYAFGIAQGISATPGESTSEIFIRMDKPLDQAVVLSASPPAPGPKGPDRLISTVSVQLGNQGYAIFPNAQRTTALSNTGDITFVGLPGLTGSLAGSRFVSSARAVSGANAGAPMSIVGKFLTTDASVPVAIDGFVQVPVLTTPAMGQPFDGRHLEVSFAPGGAVVDVTVFRIEASSGLMEWVIVAPAGKTSVELPDLEPLDVGLPHGPVNINVYAGHIDDQGFDYGSLVYQHLDTRGWLAYAYDVFNGLY